MKVGESEGAFNAILSVSSMSRTGNEAYESQSSVFFHLFSNDVNINN